MDPFDVLGLKPTNNWNKIRESYKKMLVATHPDKMGGDAKYFMMVHEAYNVLEKGHKASKKESHAPKEKPRYSTSRHDQSQQPIEVNKDMGSTQFNNFFETNRIDTGDPFRNGYGTHMSQRTNVREDDAALTQNKVNIKKRDVVIYKEPEPMSHGWTDSYSPLGVEHIDDFSTSHATDYMKAYSHPEQMVDTCKRYESRESLEKDRERADFRLTQEEKNYQKKKERDSIRLEEYRRMRYQEDLNNTTERFTQLNNRLSWRG